MIYERDLQEGQIKQETNDLTKCTWFHSMLMNFRLPKGKKIIRTVKVEQLTNTVSRVFIEKDLTVERLSRDSPSCNMKVYNSKTLVSILSQINPLLTPTHYIRSISIILRFVKNVFKAVTSIHVFRLKFYINSSSHTCVLHTLPSSPSLMYRCNIWTTQIVELFIR